MIVDIEVPLTEGVLDPQAKAISHALESLGFSNIKEVKIGKKRTLNIAGDDREKILSEAKEMSELLLANTVIEDYSIRSREK